MTSVFDKHHDALERHETMMGSARGRLAVAIDLLTDSLALVGQHGVYCRSERWPGKPRMDIASSSNSSTMPSSWFRAPSRSCARYGLRAETGRGLSAHVRLEELLAGRRDLVGPRRRLP